MTQLVIFDCDGVLVDSEPIGNRVFSEMARELGVDLSPAESLHLFRGGHMQKCIEFVESASGQQVSDNFMQEFRQRCAAAFESELQAVAGIHDVLASIDHPRCVASNGPLEKMRHMLTLTNLIDWFGENLFSAYLVQKWKPEPDLFLHAANQMGRTPAECVVVEDSRFGIEAALRAGMRVLAFAPEGCDPRVAHLDVPHFHDMRELPELLNG